MRLLILSDLHREHWGDSAPKPDLSISKPDVVILAGDIDKQINAVLWAETAFMGLPVLYVAGNHEAYGSNLEPTLDKIQQAAGRSHNVQFLNADSFVVYNAVLDQSVRFIGATLWTDFKVFGEDHQEEAMFKSAQYMNDYHVIRLANENYRLLQPRDTAELHFQHRKYIADQLAIPFDGKTVVVTHMAPSFFSVPDEYKADIVSAAYASNLDDLVAKADLWIHGHTHNSFDYRIQEGSLSQNSGRVVCNPCGYRVRGGGPENPAFNPNYIVEI